MNIETAFLQNEYLKNKCLFIASESNMREKKNEVKNASLASADQIGSNMPTKDEASLTWCHDDFKWPHDTH